MNYNNNNNNINNTGYYPDNSYNANNIPTNGNYNANQYYYDPNNEYNTQNNEQYYDYENYSAPNNSYYANMNEQYYNQDTVNNNYNNQNTNENYYQNPDYNYNNTNDSNYTDNNYPQNNYQNQYYNDNSYIDNQNYQYQQENYTADIQGDELPNNNYQYEDAHMQDGDFEVNSFEYNDDYGSGNGTIPPKKNHHIFIKLFLSIILISASAFGIYYYKTYSEVEPFQTTFAQGVSVDGVQLGGMSLEEGSELVQEQAKEKRSSWYVNLTNNGSVIYTINDQTVGLKYNTNEAIKNAWNEGKDGNIFQKNEAMETLMNNPKEYFSAQPETNTSQVDVILKKLQDSAYMEAKNASFVRFDPDLEDPFIFEEEIPGRVLNINSAKEQINEMLKTMTSGNIELEPETVQPAVTVEKLRTNFELLYRATTPISTRSTENRTNNIRVAFSRYNGLILEPGSKFSFNSIVGRRTEKAGFFEAIEYAYGETASGIGGGVCQASTTTYLAAVQSGLQIIKRVPHSDPVSYTEFGKDATVSDTVGREIDFSFKNNTDSNIYITAHVVEDPYNNNRLQCKVAIYGKKTQNIRYELETETVEILKAPTEPEIIEDEDHKYVNYIDEEKVIRTARDGAVINSYLCKIVDGVEVARTLIDKDTYPARSERVYVGVDQPETF